MDSQANVLPPVERFASYGGFLLSPPPAPPTIAVFRFSPFPPAAPSPTSPPKPLPLREDSGAALTIVGPLDLRDTLFVFLSVGLVLLLPTCFFACAFARWRRKTGLYLRWRFSHSLPQLRVGYLSKEGRELLWAHLTARDQPPPPQNVPPKPSPAPRSRAPKWEGQLASPPLVPGAGRPLGYARSASLPASYSARGSSPDPGFAVGDLAHTLAAAYADANADAMLSTDMPAGRGLPGRDAEAYDLEELDDYIDEGRGGFDGLFTVSGDVRPSNLGLRELLQAEAQAELSLPCITPRAIDGDATGGDPVGEELYAFPTRQSSYNPSGPPASMSIDAQLQLAEINAEIDLVDQHGEEIDDEIVSRSAANPGGAIPVGAAATPPACLDFLKVGTSVAEQIDMGHAAAPQPPHDDSSLARLPDEKGAEAHRQYVEAAMLRAAGAPQLHGSSTPSLPPQSGPDSAPPPPAWFPIPAHPAQPGPPWWKGATTSPPGAEDAEAAAAEEDAEAAAEEDAEAAAEEAALAAESRLMAEAVTAAKAEVVAASDLAEAAARTMARKEASFRAYSAMSREPSAPSRASSAVAAGGCGRDSADGRGGQAPCGHKRSGSLGSRSSLASCCPQHRRVGSGGSSSSLHPPPPPPAVIPSIPTPGIRPPSIPMPCPKA